MLLLFADSVGELDAPTLSAVAALAEAPIAVHTLLVTQREGVAPAGCTLVVDQHRLIARRLDGRAGTAYLLRPDQHVAARWRQLDLAAVQVALARATCNA